LTHPPPHRYQTQRWFNDACSARCFGPSWQALSIVCRLVSSQNRCSSPRCGFLWSHTSSAVLAFHHAAAALAGVEIAPKDLQSEILPTPELVPGFPVRLLHGVSQTVSLGRSPDGNGLPTSCRQSMSSSTERRILLADGQLADLRFREQHNGRILNFWLAFYPLYSVGRRRLV
jgi:hypothetical protein